MNEISMSGFLKIVSGTPIWVWAILGYLVYVGIQALKPRTVSLYRLIFLPLILILFKYRILAQPDAWIYLVLFVIGLGAGFLKVRNTQILIFKESKTIQIPGSSSMIVIFISIFVMRYMSGYLEATDPVMFLRFTPFDLGFSGLLSGFFTGQRFTYLYRYIKASSSTTSTEIKTETTN
jgi:hypothetical protein